jgi:hypothetical protein
VRCGHPVLPQIGCAAADGPTVTAEFNETLTMRVDEERKQFEQLLLRLSIEVIGEAADYSLDPSDKHPHEARVTFTSRVAPGREVGVRLDSAWLEAFFFIDPNVSILKIDDFGDDEDYTAGTVREVLAVVDAYLQGEGSIESRRTLLGRRRPQIRFEVNGREWLAR